MKLRNIIKILVIYLKRYNILEDLKVEYENKIAQLSKLMYIITYRHYKLWFKENAGKP